MGVESAGILPANHRELSVRRVGAPCFADRPVAYAPGRRKLWPSKKA